MFYSTYRIFTDIPLSSLQLSGDDYYHCDKCGVWRHVTNVHCDACGTCPSKDGRTYVHCGECGRCVKPTYVHCLRCGRCGLPGHRCSEDSEAPGDKAIIKQSSNKNMKDKKNQSQVFYAEKFPSHTLHRFFVFKMNSLGSF